MVLSLWTKAHAHYLQRNPSGSPSKPTDFYFTHNSNRPGMIMHPPSPITVIRSCDQNYTLLVLHNKKPNTLIKPQLCDQGQGVSWNCFTFCGSVFAVNKMGVRVSPHKLLGKLSHCM